MQENRRKSSCISFDDECRRTCKSRGCKIYGGKAEKPKSGGKAKKGKKNCEKPEKRSPSEIGKSHFKSRKAGKSLK